MGKLDKCKVVNVAITKGMSSCKGCVFETKLGRCIHPTHCGLVNTPRYISIYKYSLTSILKDL